MAQKKSTTVHTENIDAKSAIQTVAEIVKAMGDKCDSVKIYIVGDIAKVIIRSKA